MRLVDVRNGRPLPNETVTLQYIMGSIEQGKSNPQRVEAVWAETSLDGIAKFKVPSPAPLKLWAQAYSLYGCYDVSPMELQQILTHGVLARCSNSKQGCWCKFGKQIDQISAQPSEVVLLARPFTLWEKFLRHIWE